MMRLAASDVRIGAGRAASFRRRSEEETGMFRPTSESAQRHGARTPVQGNNTLMPLSFTRTLRLKVRREGYAWLNGAAIEVNEVFNYCNETSYKAATRTDTKRKYMSGFDLCNLTAGATQYFDRICVHYAQKRRAAGRLKLRWRVSRGARRSLGWIPFKAASLKRKGVCLRFAGKCFRVF
jgi:hypothetical protein